LDKLKEYLKNLNFSFQRGNSWLKRINKGEEKIIKVEEWERTASVVDFNIEKKISNYKKYIKRSTKKLN
jgi:hypothetical protein